MLKLDPRTKLFLVIIISTKAVISTNISDLSILLGLEFMLAIFLSANFLSFFKGVKYLLIISISLAVIQSLFANDSALFSIYNIKILTYDGIIKSLNFVLRMAIILLSALIIITSEKREITEALIRLKLPYEIAFMMGLGIRFLPEFRSDMKDRMIAIKLRGIDISKLKIKSKIKLYTYLITPAVSTAILNSKTIAISMQTKAFQAYRTRTSIVDLHIQAIDYIMIILGIVLFALSFIL